MDALTYISTKYDLDLTKRSPIEIPNMSRDPGLARLFRLLEYQHGAEIGVEQGKFSEALCRENLGVRLACIDAWKAYRGYRDHVSQDKLDGFAAATQARLAAYPGVRIIRAFSRDALALIPDKSLDFVYIDANHSFENVTFDISEWSKKVRVGGIVAGHDYVRYRHHNQIHVFEVVNAYTDAYKIAPWFVVGKEAKVEGEARDVARSWFWVKADPKKWEKPWPIKQ